MLCWVNEMIDVKIAMLLDIYGGLLTKKQYEAMDLYYNEDLSLMEIASHFQVSRQGIHENIKQGTENLLKYEKELKICEKSEKTQKISNEIKKLLNENGSKEKIMELLDSLI